MISDKVIELCTSDRTILSELHKDPSKSPGEINNVLHPVTGPGWVRAPLQQIYVKGSTADASSVEHPTADELERVLRCGKFGGKRPSDLFLKIYHDVLLTLEKDSRAGMVSPSLLASTGVVPLTIISIIPDIMRHYANLIVEAQHEVFLATNYWAASYASRIITDALRELSNRAGKDGRRVVVKVIYDRGNPKQALQNHLIVDPGTYTGDAVRLPHPNDIPNVDLEVINYHKPLLGTFHAKYMVVDRRVAVLNSNNIQDVPNLEMMCHFEGPIVESFYDMALLSWHNALTPQLPLVIAPPAPITRFTFTDGHVTVPEARSVEKEPGPVHPEDQGKAPIPQVLTSTEHQNKVTQVHETELPHDQQRPSSADKSESKGDSIVYDVNFTKQSERVQGTLKTMQDVTRHLNTVIQPNTTGDEPEDEYHQRNPYQPYILHSRHEPCPIALVNRQPYGTLGHADVITPQNQAWLAALKYATKSVFIQTPTLNAVPVVEGIVRAVRRGIDVICWICIGYNDAGELLPFQGGTNEQVVNRMYKELEKPEEKKRLQVFWYTAKDQSRPINAISKKRTCHIKLMIVDDAVGIQGNGNQDTQSWYHSQEINAMIDCPEVMAEWKRGLESNQNTKIHGRVGDDGIWRDKDGQPLKDSTGGNEGRFSTFKGIKGAIQRVRGEGGF